MQWKNYGSLHHGTEASLNQAFARSISVYVSCGFFPPQESNGMILRLDRIDTDIFFDQDKVKRKRKKHFYI